MSSSPTKRLPRAATVSRAFTKREPLRDIAQRADLRSDHQQSSPTKKKRSARAPPAQLAQRIKARHAAAAPSSLPPSSPPDYSSSQENHRLTRDDDAPDVDVKAELRKDFASGGLDEENAHAHENEPPARDSDPFGFFAVEEQLKADRAAGHAERPRAQVPQRVPVKPTPVRRDPPPRPRRRHVLPADSSFEVDDESMEVPAIFSSPSPIKRGKRPVAADDESEDEADAAAALLTEGLDKVEEEHLRAPLHHPLAGTGEKEDDDEEMQEEGDGDEEGEDGEGEEENEEEPAAPPRRSTRARVPRVQSSSATKPTRHGTRKRAKEESEDEDEDEPPKKRAMRLTTTRKAAKGKKPASRSRGTRETKAEDESDGEDFGFNSTKKKLEAERKARVAYWKEMADFSMEKEDVYVV
ncbi:hypothetical protein HDZ31DRAFT_33715 [Schizophyllum fasciatum]